MPDPKINLVLRLARQEDAGLLLQWRNDADTRHNSFHSQPIAWSDHLRWLRETLEDKETDLYIAERNGLPVGTVKVQRTGNSTELSWTVSPEQRGKGIGKQMVRQLARQISGTLVARIKPANNASVAIAKYIGMRRSVSSDGMLLFIRGQDESRSGENNGHEQS